MTALPKPACFPRKASAVKSRPGLRVDLAAAWTTDKARLRCVAAVTATCTKLEDTLGRVLLKGSRAPPSSWRVASSFFFAGDGRALRIGLVAATRRERTPELAVRGERLLRGAAEAPPPKGLARARLAGSAAEGALGPPENRS